MLGRVAKLLGGGVSITLTQFQTTHLVCAEHNVEDSIKFKAARAWGLLVVSAEWLCASALNGYFVTEESFALPKVPVALVEAWAGQPPESREEVFADAIQASHAAFQNASTSAPSAKALQLGSPASRTRACKRPAEPMDPPSAPRSTRRRTYSEPTTSATKAKALDLDQDPEPTASVPTPIAAGTPNRRAPRTPAKSTPAAKHTPARASPKPLPPTPSATVPSAPPQLSRRLSRHSEASQKAIAVDDFDTAEFMRSLEELDDADVPPSISAPEKRRESRATARTPTLHPGSHLDQIPAVMREHRQVS